jgi:hypothetical protein
MANNTDWFPGPRVDQLAMARQWKEVLAVKATAWNVPTTDVTDLTTLINTAENILREAQSTDRTAVTTTDCRVAFEALEAKMRYIKLHFFLMPPLTESDLTALGLRPKDTTQTPAKKPVNEPGLEFNKWGPHMLGFRTFIAALIDSSEEGYGMRVFFGLVPLDSKATGESPSATRLSDETHVLSSPPLSPEDLPDSFFTRRKQDLLAVLPPKASGMMCYMAARYENSKGHEAGPWGPMIHTIVP